MADIEKLGTIDYDSIRFVTLDLERRRRFYTALMDFAEVARSTPEPEEKNRWLRS